MRTAPQKDQPMMRSLETSASPPHSLEKGGCLKLELITDQASVHKIRIVWGLESFQVDEPELIHVPGGCGTPDSMGTKAPMLGTILNLAL